MQRCLSCTGELSTEAVPSGAAELETNLSGSGWLLVPRAGAEGPADAQNAEPSSSTACEIREEAAGAAHTSAAAADEPVDQGAEAQDQDAEPDDSMQEDEDEDDGDDYYSDYDMGLAGETCC